MPLLMLLAIETASVLRKPFAKSGTFHIAAPVQDPVMMQRSTTLNDIAWINRQHPCKTVAALCRRCQTVNTKPPVLFRDWPHARAL
jgi:hypothetical protein